MAVCDAVVEGVLARSDRGPVELPAEDASCVLIIDDDPRLCTLYRRIVEGAGFTAECMSDPSREALPALGFRPRLVLLDLRMPGVDGVQLLRVLANLFPGVDVAIMSGMDSQIVKASLELGTTLGLTMVRAIPKPVDLDVLRTLLQSRTATIPLGRIRRPVIAPHEITRAIFSQALEVHLQPQVDLSSGRMVGVEALARWRHPRYGLLLPESFVPRAEKDEAIMDPLICSVLDGVLEADALLTRAGLELRYSVNLSAAILHDATLTDRTLERLETANFAPERLIVEVTESLVISDGAAPLEALARLRHRAGLLLWPSAVARISDRALARFDGSAKHGGLTRREEQASGSGRCSASVPDWYSRGWRRSSSTG